MELNITFSEKNSLSPTTLIAGCGDVGCRLGKRLLAAGHKVYGLRRDISRLPKGIQPLAGDLADSDSLAGFPDHIDYVVYSAAAGRSGEEGYRKIYLQGLKNILHRLRQNPVQPRRIFFTSSTAVYHQSAGEWVDELSPTHPQTFNGKIMLEAENMLLDGDWPATIMRFGGIYGPGRNMMINKVRSGEVYSDEPVIFGNRIHAEDCAGALCHLVELDRQERCVHPLYLGVDSTPAPLSEVTRWLAEQLGVKPCARICSDRGSKRCRNQRLLDSGYGFQFPGYQHGYRQLITEVISP